MARLWFAWLRLWGLMPSKGGLIPPKEKPPESEKPKGYPDWKEVGPTVIKVDFIGKRRQE